MQVGERLHNHTIGLHEPLCAFRFCSVVLEAFYSRHDRRAAFVEELLPRFLLAAFDRDRDGAAIGTAGGRTATASISMSAPSRASPAMAMVVLAGLLWSGK